MRSVPYIAPMEIAECGAAALCMVLAYHGRHVPLAEVRRACGVSRDGTSAYALARAAKGYGLEVQALGLEVAHLRDTPLPAILHWEFNHFVVLERMDRRGGTIVDPMSGHRRVSEQQLSWSFTGVAFTFRPGPGFRRSRPPRPDLRRYRSLFVGALPALAIVAGASLLIDLVGLLFPAANQILVDGILAPQQGRWLWALASALVGTTLARTLLLILRLFVIQRLQFLIDMRLLVGFLDHMLHLPLGFFETRAPGDLVRRVEDNASIRDLLTSRAVSALLDSLMLVGYGALMLAYEPRLGGVVAALAVLRVSLVSAVRGRIQQASATELAAVGREGGALVEALSTPEATKAFGTESRMVGKVVDQLVPRINAALERRRLTSGVGQVTVLLDGLAKSVIVWFGGREVIGEHMTIGVLSSFLMLQMLFTTPLESIVQVLGDLQFVGRQLRRLEDVLESPREPNGELDPGRLSGAICLDRVSYAYAPGAPPVLQDISVDVRPGEKVAFVGPSGAGKSTLAKLLLGLYRPSSGSVRVDGLDLRLLDMTKVRAHMGAVLQEPFVFDDTVRANLTVGDEDMPIEQLGRAAQIACVDDVIDLLPGGYESRVGGLGSRLSGGQRQRLALARAIARVPAILVLDEATSSLDLETERRVHANLRSLACTRIIIAHRLATVIDADRIFVVDGGRIVDHGTYSQLASRPGPFQELVKAYAA